MESKINVGSTFSFNFKLEPGSCLNVQVIEPDEVFEYRWRPRESIQIFSHPVKYVHDINN